MVSALIPVFNHARFLRDAVLSVLRCAAVDEVLLVDDGSGDGSADLIASLAATHPRVQDLSEHSPGNRGAHARLNQLVEAARNEWVAVLNSDDLFAPGRFDALTRAMLRGTVDFFFGDLFIIDAQGTVVGQKRAYFNPEYDFPSRPSPISDWRPLLFNQNFVATTSNMIFTKTLHEKVGGFSVRRYCHDWEFALRASLLGRCLYVPHYLTCYRIHGANTIPADRQPSAREVSEMFGDVLADFPDIRDDPDAAANLRGNPYLS